MTTNRVQVRLLGDVRVVRGAQEIDPGGPVRTTVLAVLAAAAPDPVPHQRLVDAVWADGPPATARNSLQAHVSKLRRLLDPERDAGDPSLLESVGDGYRLAIDELATDIGRFRDQVAAAATAADWRTALRLGQGTPLPGCVDSWPVQAERRAWEEEHRDAVGAWVDAELEEGRPRHVISELERLVEQHPLHERFWAQLVMALDATGRRSDALETFRRARRRLVDAAGIEPGPELQEAQRTVLVSERGGPRDRPGSGHGRRVPAPRTPLVGRDAEVREVVDLLRQWRLVTIVGPGGVGKTRLATEAAGRPLDRVEEAVFVDLAGVREDHEVVAAVAGATGVRFAGDRGHLEPALVERLRGTPTLLLLDNAEHVLGPVARLVDVLLDEVGTVVLLVTSRHPLDVGGERLFPLQPMALDDAVALFLERAEARRPGVIDVAPRDTVRALCQHLDRLPLAVEIAAARTGHLSIGEILTTTAERPHATRRAAPSGSDGRHDSLTSTIAWSYDLLPRGTRAALRHLAVFRGPFDREQAAAVMSGSHGRPDVVSVLGELVAHSLLVADPHPTGTTYRLLETIRAFARAELEQHDEAESAEECHRRWYVQWAHGMPRGSTAFDTGLALSLHRHHADLVAALEHAERAGDATAVTDLAILASGLTFCPGGLPDARRWTRKALDHADEVDGARRADLLAAGMLAGMLGDEVETGRERFHAAIPLLGEHPDGLAPFVLALGMSDPHTAGAAVETADELLAHHGDDMREDIAHAIVTMRPVVTVARDRGQALVEAEAAWAERPWSDRATLATWTVHAALLHITGRHAELRGRLDRMEMIPPVLGPPTYFVSIFEALALAGDGDRDAAMDRLRRAHARHWRGIPGIESDLLSAVAAIHDLAGDAERARQLLDRPGLRARHPGTAMVHLDCTTRLGIPADDYVSDWARGPDPGLSDLLDEVLAP